MEVTRNRIAHLESELNRVADKFIKPVKVTPFKGSNFMTDNIIRRGKFSKDLFLELSWGTFITNIVIGMTFRNSKDEDPDDLSNSCHSVEELEEQLEAILEVV